jgi:hypothetical protein
MRIRNWLRFLCAGCAVAAVTLVAPVVSYAAAAQKLGLSGYSGTLSTDPITRQQQLICDPEEPIRGATSTAYNPSLVRLVNLGAGPGYTVGGAIQLIQFSPQTETFSDPFFMNLFGPGGYFSLDGRFNLFETGLVRVIYEQIGPTGQIAPTGTILDEKPGVTVDGVDTHALFFEAVIDFETGLPVDNTFAQYSVFAGPNDYMEALDDDGQVFRLGPDQLVGVTVGLPEPAGAALLFAGLIAVGGRFRRGAKA